MVPSIHLCTNVPVSFILQVYLKDIKTRGKKLRGSMQYSYLVEVQGKGSKLKDGMGKDSL